MDNDKEERLKANLNKRIIELEGEIRDIKEERDNNINRIIGLKDMIQRIGDMIKGDID